MFDILAPWLSAKASSNGCSFTRQRCCLTFELATLQSLVRVFTYRQVNSFVDAFKLVLFATRDNVVVCLLSRPTVESKSVKERTVLIF